MESARGLKVFCCYARKDQRLLSELEAHLSSLKKQSEIDLWHDQEIAPGEVWEQTIKEQLNTANIVLLLISSSFIASDYCYEVEMKNAIKRHEAGQCCVIPIILRPTDFDSTPFSKLQALPTNGTAVTLWKNRDAAFVNIVEGIRQTAERIRASSIKIATDESIDGIFSADETENQIQEEKEYVRRESRPFYGGDLGRLQEAARRSLTFDDAICKSMPRSSDWGYSRARNQTEISRVMTSLAECTNLCELW